MSILHKIFTQRATRVSAQHHRSRCLRESTTSALTVLYTSLDGATEAAQTKLVHDKCYTASAGNRTVGLMLVGR